MNSHAGPTISSRQRQTSKHQNLIYIFYQHQTHSFPDGKISPLAQYQQESNIPTSSKPALQSDLKHKKVLTLIALALLSMGLLHRHKNHTTKSFAGAVMLLLLLSGISGGRRGVASAFRSLSSFQHTRNARQSQKIPSTLSTHRRLLASGSTRNLSSAAASSSSAATTFTQQQTQDGSKSSVLKIPKKFISYPFEVSPCF